MSEQVERLIGRINVLRDKAVDLTDRYAGDRYRETRGEDTPATFPEDYLYDALIEARVVLADAKKALEAQRKENERLREILEIIRPVLTDVSWADSEPMYPRSQFSLNKAADRWKVTIEDYPELVEWTRGNDAALEEQDPTSG